MDFLKIRDSPWDSVKNHQRWLEIHQGAYMGIRSGMQSGWGIVKNKLSERIFYLRRGMRRTTYLTNNMESIKHIYTYIYMWEFAPQKKDFFWGSKYWDPFLFHITNLGSSHWVPHSIPLSKPFRSGSLGKLGIEPGIVRSLHQQCWHETWHYDRITTSKLHKLPAHRYRAPPLQTRCTRGTCASFGWREHLRTNLPMAWHRAEWAPSHSRFGSVWCEKRCFDGQIIYDCLPYSMEVFLKTTVQNRICKNYSWFEFKPCQSHGSPSWADDICHLWQTHIWHLSDTS